MTVDSRKKRTAAANLPFITSSPEPDSSITMTDRAMAAGEYAIHPWVSAQSVSEDDGWDNSANAHDSNTGTFASEQSQSGQTPLILEWAADIRTDTIRFMAHDVDIIAGTHDATNVKVEVWHGDGTYHHLGTFTFPEDVWYEYPTEGTIWADKVRITSLDDEEYLYVGEVQFLNIAVNMADSVIQKTSGGLINNPLIGGGLVK